MTAIQDVIGLVEQHPDLADPFGTVSEEAIRQAGAELGLVFPQVIGCSCRDMGR